MTLASIAPRLIAGKTPANSDALDDLEQTRAQRDTYLTALCEEAAHGDWADALLRHARAACARGAVVIADLQGRVDTLEHERVTLMQQQRDDTARIAELERTVRVDQRQIHALCYTRDAQDRHIGRLLHEVADLRRRLPRGEQHVMTPLDAFRVTHSIVDVVGQVVDLHEHQDGHRRYLAGTCPFHKDTHLSPSLVVRPWYGQFSCYVCGAAGDVVDFLQLIGGRAA